MNCAINMICRHNNVDLKIIDVGVIGGLDYEGIENKRLMEGTGNFCAGRAMSEEIAVNEINIGFEYARFAYDNNYDIIGKGEVGMGNTSTAAACIMAALDVDDCEIAVGRGAGFTDEAFALKKKVISRALEMHKPVRTDVLDILSKVGGLNIAVITGLYIGAAYYKIPIVIDGVVSIAAALLAYTFIPLIKEYMIPSHIFGGAGLQACVE